MSAGLNFSLLSSLELGNLEEEIALFFLVDYQPQKQHISISQVLATDIKLALALASINFSSTFS